MNQRILLIILMITLVGGFIRFYKLTENPPSLNIDEVAFGYDAYSILKTGRDQNNHFLPLTFQSIGDYKNPVVIYTMVPSIALFGLTEFGVRFPTALLGTLSIPLMFFLAFALTKNRNIALAASFLLAISGWHVYFSRLASDSLVGVFFLMSGVLGFQKVLEGKKQWIMPAALGLVIALYSYHSLRLFVPVFILIWLIMKRKLFNKSILMLLILVALLSVPLILLILFGQANIRTGMVFITQDIDYTRYVVLDHLYKMPATIFSHEILLLFFFWLQRLLGYFSPDFLFFNGLNMTVSGFGLGAAYLFELPLLTSGIYKMIKDRSNNFQVILTWLIVGFIPASLTNNQTNAGRSLIALPALIIIAALGLLVIWQWVVNQKKQIKISFILICLAIVSFELLRAFLIFSVHFPLDREEDFMGGSKESILYAIKNKDKYSEIVYAPKRGVLTGDVINIPHMYYLFYSKYDPSLYQQEVESFSQTGHFDKFTVRDINWEHDKHKKGVLFIGSPWSLSLKDVNQDEILKRIYLKNGQLALLIATPK